MVGRIQRGPSLPEARSLPYFAEKQKKVLEKIEIILLVGVSDPPAGYFGYPGEATERAGWTCPPGCQVIEISSPEHDGTDCLQRIATALGAPEDGYTPSCKGGVPVPGRLSADLNKGAPLTPPALGQIMADYMPEDCVLSDEGNTLGGLIKRSLPQKVHFDELQLVGGAIGQGLPVALGAAIAVPDRKVINLQADGSAMYTIQTLWTMDREAADVTVVILDNGQYGILAVEHQRMTGHAIGPKAKDMFSLESRDGRYLDFVKLGEGQGVPSVRCETMGDFSEAFQRAMQQTGPYLIHAVLRPTVAPKAAL